MHKQTLTLIDYLLENHLNKKVVSLIDFTSTEGSLYNSKTGVDFNDTILFHLLTPKYFNLLNLGIEKIRSDLDEKSFDLTKFFDDPEFGQKIKILDAIGINLQANPYSIFSERYSPELSRFFKSVPENFYLENLGGFCNQKVSFDILINPSHPINIKKYLSQEQESDPPIATKKVKKLIFNLNLIFLNRDKDPKIVDFWNFLLKNDFWGAFPKDAIGDLFSKEKMTSDASDIVKQSYIDYWIDKDQNMIHDFLWKCQKMPKDKSFIFAMETPPDLQFHGDDIFKDCTNRFKELVELYLNKSGVFQCVEFAAGKNKYNTEFLNCLKQIHPTIDFSEFLSKNLMAGSHKVLMGKEEMEKSFLQKLNSNKNPHVVLKL